MYDYVVVTIVFLFVLAGVVIGVHELRSGKTDVNLRERYGSAIVLAILALGAVYVGELAFSVFILLVSCLCIREFMKLVDVWKNKAYRVTAFLSVSLTIVAATLEPSAVSHKALSSISLEALQTLLASVEFHPFFAVIAPIIILNLLVPIVLRSYQGMVMREIATIFAVLYFGWFLAHTILLRNLSNGLELTTFFLIVVVANDVGAYAAGRAFGSHKLLPEISPKKTWEGFIGGIAGSLTAAIGFSYLLGEFNLIQALGAGVVISLTAPFGDLIVSVIKRDMNRKDAGGLIPGHGGLLDRADSIILSAPNYYYYLVLLRSLAS